LKKEAVGCCETLQTVYYSYYLFVYSLVQSERMCNNSLDQIWCVQGTLYSLQNEGNAAKLIRGSSKFYDDETKSNDATFWKENVVI
jgi:hypothetical protein